LSGAVFLFYPECQELAEPDKFRVNVPKEGTFLPVDTLIERLESERNVHVVDLTIPQQSNRTWLFRCVAMNQNARYTEWLYVNPYTGGMTGTGRSPVDAFFFSIRNLHRFLWLPPHIGRPLVGWATVVFIVVVVSGFVLWLPRTWKSFSRQQAWTAGLKIRFRKGTGRLIYDLHNTIGFYTLVPMLILALTGLCWSFTGYRNTVSNILGEHVFVQFQPLANVKAKERSTKPLSVGEIIDRQNQLMPEPGELFVSIPQDRSDSVIIQKGKTGMFSLAVKDRIRWDRNSGEVVLTEHYGQIVAVERFSDKPFGAKIAATIRALHYGEITGLSSKIVFFIVCLFAASFPMTGAVLWQRKVL
jgi:uncharacterized iron-regulated membrane protein